MRESNAPGWGTYPLSFVHCLDSQCSMRYIKSTKWCRHSSRAQGVDPADYGNQATLGGGVVLNALFFHILSFAGIVDLKELYRELAELVRTGCPQCSPTLMQYTAIL